MDFQSCATSVVGGSLPDGCLGVLMSKILGYAVVFGSGVLKIPQILNILGSKSADGLSRASFEAETLGYSIALSYSMVRGMAFNAYGECLFLLVQDIVLLILLTVFGDQNYKRLGYAQALLTIGGCGFYSGVVSGNALEYTFGGMNLLFYYARGQQIWVNWKASGTGQLSSVSTFLNFAGNAVRVLTTVQEGGGRNMLISYTTSLVLNFTLMAQIVFYNLGSKKSKKKD
mmetsp:Transcript_13162/g.27901  ORF Transcript_13162/g.27901 Transcript_13162/m.27901 type:complete len:229 (-) Transcript_13162:344-1030(-)